MKQLILGLAGVGILIGFGVLAHHARTPAAAAVDNASETNSEPIGGVASDNRTIPPAEDTARTTAIRTSEAQPWASTSPASPSSQSALHLPAPNEAAVLPPSIEESIGVLTSATASFDQKQAEWKRLKETGKLNELAAHLEQQAAADPQAPEYAAALGQAYLKQCALTEDLREKAILAMKGDQALEKALTLDPSNCEARYVKAVGMSYWPAQLNKSQEVIDQFTVLIQQQETQPSQPQFARSYLRLGEQYQKSGQEDYAWQVWQRGAALFPENGDLKNKLTAAR